MTDSARRIGFVSTRLAGTDGVSLETAKWVKILNGFGHESFFFAGESEWPGDRSYVVVEAHFSHPVIEALSAALFGSFARSPETSRKVEDIKNHLKAHLHEFVRRFDINLLVIENAMAIPMNIPLGLALAELIAETNMPTIGHHHDFYWERTRFLTGAAADYLQAAFPATLRSITHAVINSLAQRQLALRTGVSSMIVPNVMDFDTPPPGPDGYTDDLWGALDLDPGEYLILQPTRVVPRKRIERAVELVKWLELPCVLVISHAAGDEGSAYFAYLQEYIKRLDIKFRFAAHIFSDERGQTPNGQKVYSLADAYRSADLVTYPSAIEGFGNAFLEAIYHRKPIVMNAYEVYQVDIRPKGFEVVEFEDYITQDTVRQTRDLLSNPDRVTEMVEHNYAVARCHYSYTNLEKLLAALIDRCPVA
ncbi:MAG: glycosyltransferase family 4 protein [Anaerolineae bacterium]|nr:glycosyltransferase family 4 protein [Anaerolineae bacterium]